MAVVGLASGQTDPDDGEFVEIDPSGRYGRYDEILGSGAFKTVYKAFDEIEGTEVAWNQIDIDPFLESPEQLKRLYSEVELLKSMKHRNIVKFFNSWVDEKNKTINMITELFTSGSLRQYRKKHRKVDIKAIKNWSRQILQGIHYLHSHSPPIIHRDLKCDNIFVNGYDGQVKIGDLGLAIVTEQSTAHSFLGTPEYMAPELYDGEYDEKVDIYSFGICMLEMVTCDCPYSECRNAAQIYKKVSSGQKPASLSKVQDPKLKYFIEKCLAHVSIRPSASDLLHDSFLECVDSPKKTKSSSFELSKLTDHAEFRLMGVHSNDLNTIHLTLTIMDHSQMVRTVEFAYYLDSDTVKSVSQEMMEQLSLPNGDAIVVAELMQGMIGRFGYHCDQQKQAAVELICSRERKSLPSFGVLMEEKKEIRVT